MPKLYGGCQRYNVKGCLRHFERPCWILNEATILAKCSEPVGIDIGKIASPEKALESQPEKANVGVVNVEQALWFFILSQKPNIKLQ